MKIVFDQYQRYKNAQRLVNELREKDEQLKILEVGANEHKNLEHFLPGDDITYLDIELSEERLKDPRYIKGDATNMDFPDDSYDIIVALDVFEHVPEEKRENFLKELARVSRRGFLFSAPFDEEGVHEAEVRMNCAYRALYGGDHPWLIEHIENGLPKLDEVRKFLKNNKIPYQIFGHGDLSLWERLMYMQIMADYDADLHRYFEEISDCYNNSLFDRDYTKAGYRKFVVGTEKKREFSFIKPGKGDLRQLKQLEKVFYALFESKKSDRTLEKARQIADTAKRKRVYFQLYIDEGDGFLEDASIKFDYEGNKLYQKIYLAGKNIKKLRIDLINTQAVLKVNELCLVDPLGNRRPITEIASTQMRKLDEESYFCFFEDPQILLEAEGEPYRALIVDVEAVALDSGSLMFLEKLTDGLKRQNRELKNDLMAVKDSYGELQTAYGKLQDSHGKLQDAYSGLQNSHDGLIARNQSLEEEKQQALSQYQAVTKSLSWKCTFPVRKVLDIAMGDWIIRGINCIKEHGLGYTFRLILKGGYRKQGQGEAVKQEGENSIKHYMVSREEWQRQSEYKFSNPVKFSILVPLYNTEETFLRDMIHSVVQQTYQNWELCLGDGSDEEHGNVQKICREYCGNDNRILYKKLDKNEGISGNTNQCLDMASGDYIGLLDHDDLLHCSALFEAMKEIEEKKADLLYTDEATFHVKWSDAYLPHYKPDYSPDTLRSYNYICHFTVFRRTLFEEIGYFNPKFDGSQDYDYILRLTEKADRIVHIPKILYYWRAHSNSVASALEAKPYTIEAAKGALREHLARIGLEGEVGDSSIPSTYKITYKIKGNPKISILIPNKDHIDDLEKCLDSIAEKTTYPNYEIVIMENNSEKSSTFAYYEYLKKDSRIKVVSWEKEFNYAAINNFGEREAAGDYILLLNNDIQVITENWLEEMLMFAQREDVGAVGAMLYYPDDTIQHAGVILGIGGVAGHSHKYFKRGAYGYASRLTIAQNLSCVTAACLLVKKSIYEEVGGLDENFAVAFNDVDFCMSIRKAGYLNVFTPYAQLYHYESKSRGLEDTREKQKRFQKEIDKFTEKWRRELKQGDPYYNVNLTLEREDFSIR